MDGSSSSLQTPPKAPWPTSIWSNGRLAYTHCPAPSLFPLHRWHLCHQGVWPYRLHSFRNLLQLLGPEHPFSATHFYSDSIRLLDLEIYRRDNHSMGFSIDSKATDCYHFYFISNTCSLECFSYKCFAGSRRGYLQRLQKHQIYCNTRLSTTKIQLRGDQDSCHSSIRS